MSGVLSPLGYRARVQVGTATPFEKVSSNKREAKRELHREMFKAGLGARGEMFAGPKLNAGFYLARITHGNNGRLKLVVEPQPGMKIRRAPKKLTKQSTKKTAKR